MNTIEMKAPQSHTKKNSPSSGLFLISCLLVLSIHWVTVIFVHSPKGDNVKSESLPTIGDDVQKGDTAVLQIEEKVKIVDEISAKDPDENGRKELKQEVEADGEQDEAREVLVLYDRYWDEPFTEIEV